jgi:hypothetical protein
VLQLGLVAYFLASVYSPECVEVEFSEVELRIDGVLGSSPPLAPLPNSKDSPFELVKNSAFE